MVRGTTPLPNGLSVHPNTCVISGTPLEGVSNVTYTLVATNSAGTSADATVNLTVNALHGVVQVAQHLLNGVVEVYFDERLGARRHPRKGQ